ncbi:MAG: hypothetical protein RQ801_04755 [Spirochaetaceae bacterium]|nr:hypothetical protein [Spirochaetaceae bacterium]
MPGWFVLRDITRESLPGFLGTLFSAFIILTVVLIQLRRFLNESGSRRVREAVAVESSKGGSIVVEQSFTYKEYVNLQAEVMFSHLRPWMTMLTGGVFLGLFVISLTGDYDAVKSGLALVLTLYMLALPWIMFFIRVRKAFRSTKELMNGQSIEFKSGQIILRIGSYPEKKVKHLSDITVTRNYLILTVAGSNYIQVKRSTLDDKGERFVLAAAAGIVTAEEG